MTVSPHSRGLNSRGPKSSGLRGSARALLPLAVAAATALSVTACSSDDATAPADDRGCAVSSTADAQGVQPIDLPPATVTVTDEGTGERRVPAVAPTVESAQQVTLTTETSETSLAPGSGDGQDDSGVQSTVETLTLPLTGRVSCDDPANLEFTLGDPSSPDEALSSELPAIADSPGGIAFRDGLNPVTLRIQPDDDSSAPARRAVEQSLIGALTYAIPLPTTPVGVGAQWRAVRTVTAATTVTQTVEVTLTAWTGDRLTLEVTVDEVPVDAVFRIPGSTETLHLDRYANSGGGTLEVDLQRLLPISGSLTMRGARELLGADPNRPILQSTGLSVSWQPTAAPDGE